MTRDEFFDKLRLKNIDTKIIVFNNIKDGYCIRKNYFRWEVFVRERGKEYDVVGFPSESDALQYLFENLCNIYGKK